MRDVNSVVQTFLGSTFPVEMFFTYKTLFCNFFQVFWSQLRVIVAIIIVVYILWQGFPGETIYSRKSLVNIF